MKLKKWREISLIYDQQSSKHQNNGVLFLWQIHDLSVSVITFTSALSIMFWVCPDSISKN